MRAARGAPSTRGAAGIDNLHMWNMRYLLAVLVDQAPPSCWLNDLAPKTVAEVEEARR